MNNKDFATVKNPKPSKLKLVHDVVSRTHNIGDYDTFAGLMQDPFKRGTFFGAVSKEHGGKYNLGDLDTFAKYSMESAPPPKDPIKEIKDPLKLELNEFFGRKPKETTPEQVTKPVDVLEYKGKGLPIGEPDQWLPGKIEDDGIRQEPPLNIFDRMRDMKDNPLQFAPFINDGETIKGLTEVMIAGHKLKNGTATDRDKEILRDFSGKTEKDKTWAYKTLDIAAMIPAYAGEFMLTAGLYTVGKKAGQKAVKEAVEFIVKDKAKDLLEKKVVKTGAKVAAGIAGASLQTVGTGALKVPIGTMEGIVRGETPILAASKAIRNNWIDTVSEHSGGLLKEGGSYIKQAGKLIPENAFTSAIARAFSKVNPKIKSDKIKKLAENTAFHGTWGEMFEERIADLGHATFGEEEYSLPTLSQISSELVAFSVPGAIGYGISKAKSPSPKERLNYVQNTRTLISQSGDNENNEAAEKELVKIEAELKEDGFEINDLIGQPFVEDMPVSAMFLEDETLPEGEKKITRIIEPQISKNGKIVQPGVVVVGKGTGKATPEQVFDKQVVETSQTPLQEVAPKTTKIPPATPEDRVAGARTVIEKAKAKKEAAAVEKVAEAKIKKPIAVGKTGKATTESGTGIDFEYGVYEADELTASHDTRLNVNKAYPEEKQPRDRGKVATEVQVNKIIKTFNPERLGDNALVSDGAPTIDDAAVVESGNVRTIVLQKLYEEDPEKADMYRKYITDNAEKFGIDPETLKTMKNPVLARKRTSEVDVNKFVNEANKPSVAAMSAGEQAQSDAKALSNSNSLNLFQPGETGEINTARNRDFIRKFFTDIIGTTELGEYITADGSISQKGINRIRNAIFASAFGDPTAVGRLAESPDDNVKNITNGMVALAPRFAMLKNQIKNEERYDFDITDDIAKAAEQLSFLREQGTPVEEYINQTSLLDEKLTPLAKDILRVFDTNKRSAKKIMDIFNTYIDAVDKIGDPKQESMFGEGEKPTHAEILQAAINEVEGEYVPPDLFQAETERSEEIGKIDKTQKAGQIVTPEKPADKEVTKKEPQVTKEITKKAEEVVTKPVEEVAKLDKEVTKKEVEVIKEKPAEKNITDPKPTDAQIEAGNYKKRKIAWNGLTISVENEANTFREGTDNDGETWKQKMHYDYGYINRTEDKDGDQIDIFMGPNLEAPTVFVVNQIDQGTGKFDEHKVMAGFDTKEDAIAGYSKNYEKGWKVGEVAEMSVDEFKEWAKEGKQTKPAEETEKKIDTNELQDIILSDADAGTKTRQMHKYARDNDLTEIEVEKESVAKPTPKKVVAKEPETQYGVKYKPKEQGITLKDIREAFPAADNSGRDSEGNYWVDINDRRLKIYTVEEIEADEYKFNIGYGRELKPGEVVVGEYSDGEIVISKKGDKYTLKHEEYHWIEDLGVITGADTKALNRKIAENKGIDTKDVTPEDRAQFVEDSIFEKEKAQEGSHLSKIIQKIKDWISSLVNIFKRTSGGVVRDIRTGGIYGKSKGKKVPGGYQSSNAEAEARYQEALVKDDSLFKRTSDKLEVMKHKIQRVYKDLPRGTAEFAQLEFDLLKLAKQKPIAGERTVTKLNKVLEEMGEDNHALFSRKVLYDDLLEVSKEGKKLPYGFEAEEFQDEVDSLNDYIKDNKVVYEAIKKRNAMWKEERPRYIKAMSEIGFNTKEMFNRKNYFRHQVIDKAIMNNIIGSGKKLKTPSYRSFMKKREGSLLDINRDYLQPEFEVLSQMEYDIEIAKTIKAIEKNYSIVNELKMQAIINNDAAIMPFFDKLAKIENEGRSGTKKDPLTAEDIYKKMLHMKQAIGFSKLSELAAKGELPEGDNYEYANLIDTLAGNWLENKDLPAEVQTRLPESAMKELMKYANWIIKNHGGEPGSGAAASIWKGIREKRTKMKDILGSDYVEWKDLIPEGYTTWQPREGTTFYLTDTIPSSVAQQLMNDTLETYGLTKDELNKVYALGGKRKEFVVKNEVALTLDNLVRERSDSDSAKLQRELISKWKEWQLINPRRYAKYNLRNATGDLDGVIAGNPRVVKFVPRAVKELFAFYTKNALTSKEIKYWYETGGTQSTLQAQEMKDLKRIHLFTEQYKSEHKLSEIPMSAWKSYWKAARVTTDFREAILRFAAYLEAENQQSLHGKIMNYGASVPAEIDGLKDHRDKSYWISNDLLGAYDRVGIAGQYIRGNVFPFWSWKEVNMRKYAQMMKNAANSPEASSIVGNRLLRGVAKTPYTAYRVGSFALRATALLSATFMWNRFVMTDEDDDLPEDVRNKPHITYGRAKDGQSMAMTRIGALGDILEWGNFDASPYYMRQLSQGKMTVKQIALEMAKAPVNIMVSGSKPFVKLALELATKRSLFPDVFNPGTIRDSGMHLARSFGVEHEYAALSKYPSRGYGKSIPLLFYYKYDPLETAYWDILGEKRDFLKSKEKIGTGFWLTPKGNALYNIKLAIRYGDEKAADLNLVEYLEKGGTFSGIASSIKNMSPISGMNTEEIAEFGEWLGPEKSTKVAKAIKFYTDNKLEFEGYMNKAMKDPGRFDKLLKKKEGSNE